MRGDEFQREPYDSLMARKLSGEFDAQGNVVGWTRDVWSHPHNNDVTRVRTGDPRLSACGIETEKPRLARLFCTARCLTGDAPPGDLTWR